MCEAASETKDRAERPSSSGPRVSFRSSRTSSALIGPAMSIFPHLWTLFISLVVMTSAAILELTCPRASYPPICATQAAATRHPAQIMHPAAKGLHDGCVPRGIEERFG